MEHVKKPKLAGGSPLASRRGMADHGPTMAGQTRQQHY